MNTLNFIQLQMFVLVASLVCPIHGLNPRKLDDANVPGSVDEKCTPCTVNSPPPPSPPPPSPPPPDVPYYSPPPPKKPPSNYCPPPPLPPSPPSFTYITGPPGANLYPINNDYSGASRSDYMGFSGLVGYGLLVLLVRFGFI